jgi:energy-coupling factor transport system substrate-specific component
VSWQLASFLIVALVLGGGWLAYERRRPSARMVAVVATLAAIAALGRDAFVALPDVKPITAITFVVGYALGPLPGFSVGAIGMLASNMMLGQGPYTPWQMAAWGLVGLAGAAVGRLGGRRLGRMPLALGCALAALAAKEIMNLYTWTIGAIHTPAAFVAIAGTALPFDITDVVATFLFALAFGPELARLLARTRERMTVAWEKTSHPLPASRGRSVLPPDAARTALLVIFAVSAASGLIARGVLARASTITASAASVAPETSFLLSAQNPNGGFGAARGQPSSELYTAWAAMGLAAGGRNPAGVRRNGHSVLSALRGEASTLGGLGDDERTILALHACGASAYSFSGRNLVAELMRGRERDNSFGHQVNLTAFAIIALRAVGHSPGFRPIRQAASWIERQQNGDSGFSFGAYGSPSDIDDTGAVLQALADAGARDARVLRSASAYLGRTQNPDGGYPQQPGGQSNAQSTAWAAQGLLAVGYNPSTFRGRSSRAPIGYLETLVAPGGSVRYSRTSSQTPVWVTAQATIALARRIFPVAP